MTQTLRATDRSMLVKVPEITIGFWTAKLLTTAFGESASDFLVHAMPPVAAVLLGFVAFLVALGVQLRARAYRPATYWFAVAMVGVFGTMAADVLHVGFGVPYAFDPYFYQTNLLRSAVCGQCYSCQRDQSCRQDNSDPDVSPSQQLKQILQQLHSDAANPEPREHRRFAF